MNETIKEIYAIIGDIHEVVARNDENKKDLERTYNQDYDEDEEWWVEQAKRGMVDAKEAMETVSDDLELIEYTLKRLIESIEDEQLSAKIQAM